MVLRERQRRTLHGGFGENTAVQRGGAVAINRDRPHAPERHGGGDGD
jgi:hypothetical protein